MGSTKTGKIIGYSFLILLGVFLVYAFYNTFVQENPSPYLVIVTVFILTIFSGIIILVCLEKAALLFPTNKTLKKIAKKFEKVWTNILDGFFGA